MRQVWELLFDAGNVQGNLGECAEVRNRSIDGCGSVANAHRVDINTQCFEVKRHGLYQNVRPTVFVEGNVRQKDVAGTVAGTNFKVAGIRKVQVLDPAISEHEVVRTCQHEVCVIDAAHDLVEPAPELFSLAHWGV